VTLVADNRRRHFAAGLLLVAIVSILGMHARPAGAKALTLAKRTFQISGADQKRRLVVRCPGRQIPFGGGIATGPAPGLDGEGAYPHSYERLGVQSGFHSTVVMFDPAGGGTQGRNVTLQVVCGRKGRHVTPPHRTINVSPGQTRTAVATCPGRRHLFGGGFQRTDFLSDGGDYINSSRALDSKSWAVTGSAFGFFGGELTAIAYCRRSKNPLVTEVASEPTVVAPGKYGTAATPSCPPGTGVVFGGFESSPAGPLLITDTYVTTTNGFTAAAFNHFGGSAASVTAYGYCHRT
jgi:hypothetical protein